MTPNPATMTVQEAMDFAAVAKGYTKCKKYGGWHGGPNFPSDSCESGCVVGMTTRTDHPFQPTLDSAASAMPSGWKIHMESHVGSLGYLITAWKIGNEQKVWGQATADTELLARWRLVVACMLAEKEGSNGKQ